MKLHPQSPEQIKAFLDGRRTQVRVLCVDQTPREYRWVENHQTVPESEPYTGWVKDIESLSILVPTESPLGNPGDVVGFTEEWAEVDDEYGTPLIAFKQGGYRIAGLRGGIPESFGGTAGEYLVHKWHPASEMPEWACRIKREIVSARVERLAETTEVDAIDEGATAIEIECVYPGYTAASAAVVELGGKPLLGASPLERFKWLWDRDHPDHPFSGNPWVWVYEVKEGSEA